MIFKLIFIIKVFCIKIKHGSKIKMGLKQQIHWSSSVRAKKGHIYAKGVFTFGQRSTMTAVDGLITIGKNAYFGRNCIIVCKNKITIGDGCAFGPNVTIYDHNHKFDETGFYATQYTLGEVVVGENCWIGTGAILLKGTKIGEGSIVGAGCVISEEIPAHSLVTRGAELKIVPLEKKEARK